MQPLLSKKIQFIDKKSNFTSLYGFVCAWPKMPSQSNTSHTLQVKIYSLYHITKKTNVRSSNDLFMFVINQNTEYGWGRTSPKCKQSEQDWLTHVHSSWLIDLNLTSKVCYNLVFYPYFFMFLSHTNHLKLRWPWISNVLLVDLGRGEV